MNPEVSPLDHHARLIAQLQARNEALTTERNAALDEARKANARAEDADDLPRIRDVARIGDLEAECERRRARERELVAALERASQHTVDTVTEERRLLSEECERLRAALADAEDATATAKQCWDLERADRQHFEGECERLRAALRAASDAMGEARDGIYSEDYAERGRAAARSMCASERIDAVLAGATAEPTVTREQVEREIADWMPDAWDAHVDIAFWRVAKDGGCIRRLETVDVICESIRSGAYRKTSESAPAATGPVCPQCGSATVPAPIEGDAPICSNADCQVVYIGPPVAEDRSEPAPICTCRWANDSRVPDPACLSHDDRSDPPAGYRIEYDPVVDVWRPKVLASFDDHEAAVSACWAHCDAVRATDTRIERALAILRGYERHVSAAIAALEDKP
jgi:hypothetical protein